MLQKKEIKELMINPFAAVGDEWMLITAGTKENCNTMTAAWGGLGVLWKKNVATIYVRPQRYTKKFVDEQEYFTLCFFGDKYREELALCGTKSGRDMDKIKACNFTVVESENGAPYFEEARLVLVCRKLYQDTLKQECFLDRACDEKCYPEHDYHDFYVGEVVEVLEQI